jgi:hypothetical protein
MEEARVELERGIWRTAKTEILMNKNKKKNPEMKQKQAEMLRNSKMKKKRRKKETNRKDKSDERGKK